MAAFPDLNNIYVPSQARVDAQLQQREANKLAILARQDQMARAKDDAARQGRVRNAFAANAGDPRGQAAAVAGDDPELSFKLMEHVRQLDAGERDRQVKEAGLVAQAFANLPDDPAAYAQTVQALRMAGVDKPFPEYQPGIGQAMARLSGATVKAGNLVAAEDPQGNPIFIQQDGRGGVRPVPGYRPPRKAPPERKPMSTVGKLGYDLGQGFIDQGQFDQGMAALNKPLTSTNVNLGGEREFAKESAKNYAKNLTERGQAALDAAQSLQSTAEARALLKGGVITGFGAEFKLGLGKALQAAGFNFDADAIANTEAFAASRAQEVGRIIKLFGAGTGLSDADREFATKAAAGQITLNEASIRRILDINERAARNVIKKYGEARSQLSPEDQRYYPEVTAPPEQDGDGGRAGSAANTKARLKAKYGLE